MKTTVLLMPLVGVVFLVACSTAATTRTPIPPSTSSRACSPIDATDPTDLVEVYFAGVPGDAGAAVSLLQVPLSNVILSLHVGNPSLQHWNLWSSTPTEQLNLGIVSRVASGFSPTGDLVMGATRSDKNGTSTQSREHVDGILLWDTHSGQLISCIRGPCPNRPPSDLLFPTVLGATLQPSGGSALTYNEIGVTRVSLPDVAYKEVYQAVYPDMRAADYATIGFVAWDTTGERYVVGLQEGEALVATPGAPWWTLFTNPQVLGQNDINDPQPIADMRFSPSGQWLAQARGGAIRVWDLRKLWTNLVLQLPREGVENLAFDQTSQYLYVANGESIDVVDLAARSVVGRLSTPGITAMSVAPDNRLLLWGDSEGTIHALGNCDQ